MTYILSSSSLAFPQREQPTNFFFQNPGEQPPPRITLGTPPPLPPLATPLTTGDHAVKAKTEDGILTMLCVQGMT